MRPRSLPVALAALLALVPEIAPAQTRYVDELFTDYTVTEFVYGEGYNSSIDQIETLKLDVYQPVGDTATGRGLYVWIHGGNFRVGTKASNGPLEDYVRRGWVGISIDYRLHPELPGNAAIGAITNPTSLPAFVDAVVDARHDSQAAIRWARHNADFLGVDPNRIAVGGMSAGAILSLMVAFNSEDPGETVTPDVPAGVSSAVAAAISHAGAYAPVLLGDAPKPGDPPIAVYHGTSDEQVPYPLAPLVCLLTLAALNDCEYVTFVGETHETLGTDLARDFLYRHVILGRSKTNVPLIATVTPESMKVYGGAEPAGVDLGVTAGVLSTTDPEEVSDNTLFLLRYAVEALGLDSPF